MKLFKCTAEVKRDDGRINKIQMFIEAPSSHEAEAICFEYVGDKFGDFTVKATRTRNRKANNEVSSDPS